ncbi:MAG: M28 family peptidase, partial [Candidatus Thorarchaeota archaeon]
MRVTILVLLLLSLPFPLVPYEEAHAPIFNGDNALDHIIAQCDFGPRPPGSENLSLCRDYIADTLIAADWNITLQNFTYKEVECVNIIATWHEDSSSRYILGAHYDTRPRADEDPNAENWDQPVLGANDGGSGVGVLLELASILPTEVKSQIELVFFDAEDSGNIVGLNWDWIVGSEYYVDQLESDRIDDITAMILVDMVGDIDLRIPREAKSIGPLQDAIWSVAADLEYDDIFLDTPGGAITDDHVPFIVAGIPAVDLIHTPFPSTWHTIDDIPERCSADSLEAVGVVLEVFLVAQMTVSMNFETDSSFDLV